MRKAVLFVVVGFAIGLACLAAIVWTSVNHREGATASSEMLATKIAEHRFSYALEIDRDRSSLESARPLIPTATPTER
tara:strand:- start:2662 stop:2895 length:234 start_codon:yes stop_codon:yes gene_type:complete